jgi:rubrerythrin
MSIFKIDQIHWEQFDAQKVNPQMVPLIKMASLVEYNSGDYVDYLLKVFAGDEELCQEIRKWGEDERQHGLALRLWAERVDPQFDFEKSFTKFTSVFKIPSGDDGSIRGSKARELVSRCLIETGTTTYYSALADAADEPVLKEICKLISADEVHHYKLFFKHLDKYGAQEGLGRVSKLKTALGRILEVEDEELAMAYGCANFPDKEIHKEDYRQYSQELVKWSFQMYKPAHFQKAARLVLTATGLPSAPWLAKSLSSTAYSLMKWREKRV